MPLLNEKVRAALLKRLDTMRREALEQLRNANGDHDHAPVDRAEQAEIDRTIDVDRGVDAIARQALSEVDEAQARLEGGTYGRCMTCSMDIAPDRLTAHPTAVRCAKCQAAFDRSARSSAC